MKAMIMTHTQAKGQGQTAHGSKETDGWTDGGDCISLRAW